MSNKLSWGQKTASSRPGILSEPAPQGKPAAPLRPGSGAAPGLAHPVLASGEAVDGSSLAVFMQFSEAEGGGGRRRRGEDEGEGGGEDVTTGFLPACRSLTRSGWRGTAGKGSLRSPPLRPQVKRGGRGKKRKKKLPRGGARLQGAYAMVTGFFFSRHHHAGLHGSCGGDSRLCVRDCRHLEQLHWWCHVRQAPR